MRKLVAGVLAAVCCASLAACGDDEQATSAAEPGKLRVLAGSELADMKPVLDAAAEATGVRVEFTFSGSVEGADTLAGGKADGHYDAVWFSSNRYLQALPEAAKRLGNQVKVMGSPVVLGVARSKAAELGWDAKPVTWADIATAAGERKFTYGMTDPSASNSGFSALVGIASALAGTGTAISAEQIGAVTPALTRFFGAQAMSAGSSGWLSESYQRRATGADPGAKIDGLINYESVLLTLNSSGGLPEPLTIIRPADGVVTADYPLTLLNGTSDHARGDHQKLTDHLRSADVQRRIMESTHRRPAVPSVPPAAEFGAQNLVELPFPATAQAFDALLSAYFDKIRRPSRTVYVLDTSGSMAGDRIQALRSAVVGLTGGDGSLVGRFSRFRGREEVTLLPFNSTPEAPQTFVIPEADQQGELDKIKAFAENLNADGGTAIYDSLNAAYAMLAREPESDRFLSVVLMTDGQNTGGTDIGQFERGLNGHRARAVPVFTVLFGESEQSEMDRVAKITGGKVFDARDADLGKVFREIRGYQ